MRPIFFQKKLLFLQNKGKNYRDDFSHNFNTIVRVRGLLPHLISDPKSILNTKSKDSQSNRETIKTARYLGSKHETNLTFSVQIQKEERTITKLIKN